MATTTSRLTTSYQITRGKTYRGRRIDPDYSKRGILPPTRYCDDADLIFEVNHLLDVEAQHGKLQLEAINSPNYKSVATRYSQGKRLVALFRREDMPNGAIYSLTVY